MRYLGASSMAAWQFSKALYLAKEHGWHRFIAMQNHYNLVYREEEREMIPLCIDQGVGIIPWSPLARGFLTGTRQRDGGSTARSQVDSFAKDMYYSEDDFQVADAVAESPNSVEFPRRRSRAPGCCKRRALQRPSSEPPRRSI